MFSWFGKRKKAPRRVIPPRKPISHQEAKYPDGFDCETDDQWFEIVWNLKARLPWVGQDVSPIPSIRRRRNQPLTTDDTQRVLLSWLGGGSASQVAVRASVSRRSVYNVLRKFIYASDSIRMMGYWHDLGLIECLVTPWRRDVDESSGQSVICLICHQTIAPYDWHDEKLKVGQTFRPDLLEHRFAWYNMHLTASNTQGHLIFHYLLFRSRDRRGLNIHFKIVNKRQDRVWDNITDETRNFIHVHQSVKDEITAPEGPGVSDSRERWQQWYRRLFENRKVGRIPMDADYEPPAIRS